MDDIEVFDGQTLNCILSTEIMRKHAGNVTPAISGNTEPDYKVAYTGCILFRPRQHLQGTPNGERNLIPVFGALQGAGNKTGGVESIMADYYPIGFNISTDTRADARFARTGQACVSGISGKMSIPVISEGWRAGDLLKVVIPEDTAENRANQRKRLPDGVPGQSFFAELRPVESTTRLNEPSTWKTLVSKTQAAEILAMFAGNTPEELIEKFYENIPILYRFLRDIQQTEEPVVAVALTNGTPKRKSTIYAFPQAFFAK